MKKNLIIGLVAAAAAYLLYRNLKSRGALGIPPPPPPPPFPPPFPPPPPPPAPTWPAWTSPYYGFTPTVVVVPSDAPDPADFWIDGTVKKTVKPKKKSVAAALKQLEKALTEEG